QHDYRYWAASLDGVGGGTNSFGALLAHAGTAWPVKLTTVAMLLLATSFVAPADAIGRWRRAPALTPAPPAPGRARLGGAGLLLAGWPRRWRGLAHAAKAGAARHGAAMMAAIA